MSFKKHILPGLILLMCPLIVGAQTDLLGQVDTVYAELARIDESNWTVTISLTNDEWIEALSLPFIISAGDIKIVGDSAIYTGGRVDDFDWKGYRADSSIQCFTLGLMANMGPLDNGLPPGSGRIATVFVSSLEGEPIEQLMIDSTTTPPSNTLMMVAQRIQPGDPPDTIPYDQLDKTAIMPAFVIKKTE